MKGLQQDAFSEGIPDFKPIGMPAFLYVPDFPHLPVHVTTLSDEQARAVWRQQEQHFLAWIKRLKAEKAKGGATKRWSR